VNYTGRELIVYKSLINNFGRRDEKTLNRFVKSLKNCDSMILTNILNEMGSELESNSNVQPPSLNAVKARYKKRASGTIKAKCKLCNGIKYLNAVSDRMGELIPVDKAPYPDDDLTIVMIDCSCNFSTLTDFVEKYARGHSYSCEASDFIRDCRNLKEVE
jgi:hypothetical protein